MLVRILALAATALVIGACASSPEETASTSTASETTGASAPATGGGSAPITAERAPVESGVKAGSAEDFVVNVGDRVYFSFDRFDLSPEARETLRKQSQWLRRYPRVTITVAGHCDERGTREYNLALGERRATAVKNFLVALGVDSSRIRTVSYGKERPVDPRSNEEAWAKNRRAVTQLDDTSLSLSN